MQHHDMRSTMQGIRERAGGAMPPPGEVRERAVGAVRIMEETPSTAYVAAVFGAMTLSLLLLLMRRQTLAIFVGLWPPTILSLMPLLREQRRDQRLSREIDESMRQMEREGRLFE